MHSTCYRCSYFMFILIFCWLAAGTFSHLHAQMTAVVNSTADDEDAYPFDNPDTPDIDESIDGVCGDAKGRCTLRAAIEEAKYIEQNVHVTFGITGTIVVDSLLGSFQPPSGSLIEGNNQQVTIRGEGSFPFLMQLDSNTTVRGLVFRQAWNGIDVLGKHNEIGGIRETEGNIFLGMEQAAIALLGDSNLVIGNQIGIGGDGDAIFISPNGDTSWNHFGIFVAGSYNIIGGTEGEWGNTISRNLIGISLIGNDSTDSPCKGNSIFGNKIGTDYDGILKKPNGVGIEMLYGGDHFIGTGTEVFRNIISGNRESGILVGIGTHDVTIIGNYIGLNISHTGLGNKHGIILGPGSSSCLVDKNLIDANSDYGIEIVGGHDAYDYPSKDHLISGNEIMFNVRGIVLGAKATNNVVGSSLTTNYEPNQIQLNEQGGVVLGSPEGTPNESRANTVRKNFFLDNGGKGIIVSNSQDNIKPPTILSYYEVIDTTQAIVTGTHHRPGSLIDLYVGQKQTSDHYEGGRWLGAGFVQSDNTFSISISPCNCNNIVATATDAGGNTSEFSGNLATPLNVQHEDKGQPSKFFLGDAYPNPCNPTTTIKYQLPIESKVTLTVYNVLGQVVKVLVDEIQTTGYKSVEWDASGIASGMYFYRISVQSKEKNFVDVKKMLLLK